MPTIEENRKMWDHTYPWIQDGDEWDDQAAFCKVNYSEWKQSIIKHFLEKNIGEDSVVLEIAPGHGRWTEEIVKRAKEVFLVDLSSNCISFCKKKFSNFKNISYFVNDGKKIDFIEDNSIDFIWSYDAFVHIEKEAIESYFKEFSRVLKKEGKAIIHHANKRHAALWLGPSLKSFGRPGRLLYNLISIGKMRDIGWRSNVSKKLITKFVQESGLRIESQIDSWGDNNRYNTKLFGDCITTVCKDR